MIIDLFFKIRKKTYDYVAQNKVLLLGRYLKCHFNL